MDKPTRAAIERATQRARRLLEDDFAAQLEGTYDVLLSGQVAPSGGAHLDSRQQLLRQKIVAAVEHKRAAGMKPAEAVADYLRDAAFTTLNRFVALKMLEARELVLECVSKGDESSGYREFCGLAEGVPLLPDGAGYRLYLECILDELSTEVKVLFDRRDAASLLWPRRSTLESVLASLNANELIEAWQEDETIGWVYQYFNSDEERIVMRKQSRAPRDSRELAVRNQFFTPRFIVEFLVDNSLGLIWYEMHQGKTSLSECCSYLIRRPNEVFLARDEPIAPHPSGEEGTPDLLMQPAYINFREKKDPRDLKILDPACGSGHFLLYAFDLLTIIYHEGWLDDTRVSSELTGRSLREDYPDLSRLRVALPSLILRHNLYGIEIDVRAAQIAALALWMRAQRAYKESEIPEIERPRISRTNIVVAEGMPGEKELRIEFLSTLDKQLSQLTGRVFNSMELANELGSLLHIETEIQRSIRSVYGESGELFRESDQERWANAEERLGISLESYARLASSESSHTLRLFVEDMHRGFAFLHLCTQRYDVIVANPPFGEASKATKKVIDETYPNSRGDLLANFAERINSLFSKGGRAGIITSRTPFFLGSFENFRRNVLSRTIAPDVFVDLGEGVLDATVETCAWLFQQSPRNDGNTLFFRLVIEEDRQQALKECLRAVAFDETDARVFVRAPRTFDSLPGAPWAYWVSTAAIVALSQWPSIEGNAAHIRVGLQTSDDFRFLRLIWEVPPESIVGRRTGKEPIDIPADCREALWAGFGRWVPYSKTDVAVPWYSPITMVVNWASEGAEIKAFAISKGYSPTRNVRSEGDYFKAGFSYMLRSSRLVPYLVPSGTIPTAGRAQVFPFEGQTYSVLAVCASNVGSAVARFRGEKFAWPKFQASMVQELPICNFELDVHNQLRAIIDKYIGSLRELVSGYEPFQEFTVPAWMNPEQPYFGWDLHSLLGADQEFLVAESYGLEHRHLLELQRDIDESLIWRTRRSTTVGLAEQESAEASTDHDDATSDGQWLAPMNNRALAIGMISYAIGVCFGRWDIRLASTSRFPDADNHSISTQIRVTPPGSLLGVDGLPAISEESKNYPIKIAWDGVLVDDEHSVSDILERVEGVLRFLSSSDRELLTTVHDALGDPAKDFRAWLSGTFFDEHRRTYTRNRRQAPIYWQLSTADGRYSVWLYYHRLTKDTFYRILNDYTIPKLHYAEEWLKKTAEKAGTIATPEVSKRVALTEELRAFRAEVEHIAPLWNPNLNDGVLINFAPLWRLVPNNKPWQKELKATWDALCNEQYDWSHLAMHLWPERVVPKCATDRSLAIAHGLEDVFWLEGEDGKWKPRPIPARPVNEIVAERTSPAVKAALKSLLEAPSVPGGGGRGRPRGRRGATA